jgi:murein DD-endopeptidase MepM/ murein hydrolase activator NlpD
VPAPSRFKALLLVFLLVVLVVVGTVSYIAWRQTVPRPTVTIAPAPRLIGSTTALAVTVQAARGNIAVAEVRLVQGGTRATAAKLEASPASRIDLPAVIEPRAIGIKEGGATLEVWARDDFWRPLRFEDKPVVSVPITIDLTPPAIEVLSATQYLYQGGGGLVAFRVKGGEAGRVRVGTMTFPSFPVGDGGARISLFALPWNMPLDTPIAIIAQDEAGNTASRGLQSEVRPRRFPRDVIEIKDGLLQAKVPELLPQYPPDKPLLDGFLVINRDQRQQAEDQKRQISAKTADRALWEGAFVQPPNSKVFSNFAETRTYRYKGKEIDTQVHLGYDVASLKQSPVPAANKGVVVFAGPLTIYGNTVIVDHGLGLQSLYGHLSRIDVKVGDTVAKAQELGRSGTTGLAIGDHIHFETLIGGVSVTPVEWWDLKWIRDRVGKPLKDAGLPEIAGVQYGGGAAEGKPDAPRRRAGGRRR